MEIVDWGFWGRGGKGFEDGPCEMGITHEPGVVDGGFWGRGGKGFPDGPCEMGIAHEPAFAAAREGIPDPHMRDGNHPRARNARWPSEFGRSNAGRERQRTGATRWG
ncbi:MAG: hypothetical protein AMXMBFR47_14210 [Planctomycetota bacterium]